MITQTIKCNGMRLLCLLAIVFTFSMVSKAADSYYLITKDIQTPQEYLKFGTSDPDLPSNYYSGLRLGYFDAGEFRILKVASSGAQTVYGPDSDYTFTGNSALGLALSTDPSGWFKIGADQVKDILFYSDFSNGFPYSMGVKFTEATTADHYSYYLTTMEDGLNKNYKFEAGYKGAMQKSFKYFECSGFKITKVNNFDSTTEDFGPDSGYTFSRSGQMHAVAPSGSAWYSLASRQTKNVTISFSFASDDVVWGVGAEFALATSRDRYIYYLSTPTSAKYKKFTASSTSSTTLECSANYLSNTNFKVVRVDQMTDKEVTFGAPEPYTFETSGVTYTNGMISNEGDIAPEWFSLCYDPARKVKLSFSFATGNLPWGMTAEFQKANDLDDCDFYLLTDESTTPNARYKFNREDGTMDGSNYSFACNLKYFDAPRFKILKVNPETGEQTILGSYLNVTLASGHLDRNSITADRENWFSLASNPAKDVKIVFSVLTNNSTNLPYLAYAGATFTEATTADRYNYYLTTPYTTRPIASNIFTSTNSGSYECTLSYMGENAFRIMYYDEVTGTSELYGPYNDDYTFARPGITYAEGATGKHYFRLNDTPTQDLKVSFTPTYGTIPWGVTVDYDQAGFYLVGEKIGETSLNHKFIKTDDNTYECHITDLSGSFKVLQYSASGGYKYLCPPSDFTFGFETSAYTNPLLEGNTGVLNVSTAYARDITVRLILNSQGTITQTWVIYPETGYYLVGSSIGYGLDHPFTKSGNSYSCNIDEFTGNFQILQYAGNVTYNLWSPLQDHTWPSGTTYTNPFTTTEEHVGTLSVNKASDLTISFVEEYGTVNMVKAEYSEPKYYLKGSNIPDHTYEFTLQDAGYLMEGYKKVYACSLDNFTGDFQIVYAKTEDAEIVYGPNEDRTLANQNIYTNPLTASEPGKFSLDTTDAAVVTIFFTIDYNAISNTGANYVDINSGMPVFPNGVKDEYELKDYRQPVYYLMSKVLNNERVTPEYQLTKVEGTDNTYEITFTMRNTKCVTSTEWKEEDCYLWIAKYDTPYSDMQQSSTRIGWNQLDDDIKNGGYSCRLRFIPGSGDTTDIISLEKIDNGQMPFISIVNPLRQNKTYTTPGGKYTWAGWQEAWLQFSEDGSLLKDRKGNVMYNTLWPPKNPVKLYGYYRIGASEFYPEYSSDNLTFTKHETHTGADWKADERFAAYIHENITDENLKGSGYNEERLAEISQKAGYLYLDDDTNYTLYTGKDLWLGDFKLWTGWGGDRDSEKANVENHMLWGNISSNTLVANASTPLMSLNSTSLANEENSLTTDSNRYFSYYSKGYLFVDNEKPAEEGHTVLLVEEDYAAPYIVAMSCDDDTRSMFRIHFNNTDLDGLVQSITLYAVPKNKSGEQRLVFSKSHIYKTFEEFNNSYTTLFKDSGFETNESFVIDKNYYSAGDYTYKLIIVYTGCNAPDTDISSNPFTISYNVNVSVTPYQLIINKSDDVKCDGEKADYVTFLRDASAAYAVKAVNDNDVNDSSFLGTEFKYRKLDSIPDQDYYTDGQKCKWTDRVLLLGNAQNDDSIDIVGYNTSENAPSAAKAVESDYSPLYVDSDGRFINAVKNNADIADKTGADSATYYLTMEYKTTSNDRRVVKTTSTASANFTPSIPVPKSKNAETVMWYGSEPGLDEPDTGSFGNIYQFNITDAYYQKMGYMLEANWPDVSQSLADKITPKVDFCGEEFTSPQQQGSPIYVVKSSISSDVTATCTVPYAPTILYGSWGNITAEGSEVTFSKSPRVTASTCYKGWRLMEGEGNLYENYLQINGVRLTECAGNSVALKSGEFGLHEGSDHDYVVLGIRELTTDGQTIDKMVGLYSCEELMSDEGVSILMTRGGNTHYYDGIFAVDNFTGIYSVIAQHVYPFSSSQIASQSSNAPAKAGSTTAGTTVSVSATGVSESLEAFTDADSITADSETAVIAGKGFIEVKATGSVEIFNVDGTKVATGEGRHNLDSGVYVVRYNGNIKEVMVR